MSSSFSKMFDTIYTFEKKRKNWKKLEKSKFIYKLKNIRVWWNK